MSSFENDGFYDTSPWRHNFLSQWNLLKLRELLIGNAQHVVILATINLDATIIYAGSKEGFEGRFGAEWFEGMVQRNSSKEWFEGMVWRKGPEKRSRAIILFHFLKTQQYKISVITLTLRNEGHITCGYLPSNDGFTLECHVTWLVTWHHRAKK